VFTADHNAFNCTPLSVLNITRESMARYGFSPPTRVFEAAGAAACLITDAWEGLELFLEPEREVLVASNGDEVAEHLRGLQPARAAALGAAARRRVLADHVYARRVEQLEEVLAVGTSGKRSGGSPVEGQSEGRPLQEYSGDQPLPEALT
jgi:spore maturation protein CgeB